MPLLDPPLRIGFAAGVVALLVVVATRVRRARRQVAQLYPVGSTYAVALEPDGLWTRSALGSGIAAYSAFRSVWASGAAVVVRQRTAALTVVPAAALGDDGIAELRRRIESATA